MLRQSRPVRSIGPMTQREGFINGTRLATGQGEKNKKGVRGVAKIRNALPAETGGPSPDDEE